jgi:hypothetical protein
MQCQSHTLTAGVREHGGVFLTDEAEPFAFRRIDARAAVLFAIATSLRSAVRGERAKAPRSTGVRRRTPGFGFGAVLQDELRYSAWSTTRGRAFLE